MGDSREQILLGFVAVEVERRLLGQHHRRLVLNHTLRHPAVPEPLQRHDEHLRRVDHCYRLGLDGMTLALLALNQIRDVVHDFQLYVRVPRLDQVDVPDAELDRMRDILGDLLLTTPLV